LASPVGVLVAADVLYLRHPQTEVNKKVNKRANYSDQPNAAMVPANGAPSMPATSASI